MARSHFLVRETLSLVVSSFRERDGPQHVSQLLDLLPEVNFQSVLVTCENGFIRGVVFKSNTMRPNCNAVVVHNYTVCACTAGVK